MLPLRDNVPSRSWPIITVALILANMVVFYFQLTAIAAGAQRVVADGHHLVLTSGFEQMVWRFGLRPTAPLSITVLTSMFVHGGWLHLLGNMLYLWIFGDNVEDVMGHVRFLLFYLLSGLAAAATQLAVNPTSATPMVGASGAIAGVLGAYLITFPRAKILTVVPIFVFLKFMQIPAVIFLGVWFLFQIWAAQTGGGIAWYAHIGGFVFGLGTVKFLARR